MYCLTQRKYSILRSDLPGRVTYMRYEMSAPRSERTLVKSHLQSNTARAFVLLPPKTPLTP